MYNGISKIVKSWAFNQFLLKSRRLQPHYIDAEDITQPGTKELRLSSRTSRQICSEAGVFDRAKGI